MSCVAGMLAYLANRGRRRRVRRYFHALSRATGCAKSPAALTRDYYRRQLMEVIVGYVLQKASPRDWDRLLVREGYERVNEVVKQGRGLVLCGVHFGTYAATISLLAHEGHRLLVMRPAYAKDITSRRLREMLLIHHDAIYVGSAEVVSPLRAAVRGLREGKILGVVMDGGTGEAPVYLPFLGGQIPIHRGALTLAHHARAPIAFGISRIDAGRVVASYGPVMEPGPDGYSEEQMDAFLRECVARYEQMVRKYPENVWWLNPLCEALGLAKSAAGRGGDF